MCANGKSGKYPEVDNLNWHDWYKSLSVWRWLSCRLLKCQSLSTTGLLRTTLAQMIIFYLSITRVQFKILLITFKAIHGLAPKYLCELLTFKSSLYNLRSSGSILVLSMPAVRPKTTLGDRAFMVAAPTLWNCLPKELQAITNVNSFPEF